MMLSAKMFITFVRRERERKKKELRILHSLALVLTLTFNHLANKLLQATIMLYALW